MLSLVIYFILFGWCIPMKNEYTIDWKVIGILLVLFIVVVFLWRTIYIFPLKIFVVLLHELSHGLAAVITGGKIIKIELSAMQGGVCYTSGGLSLLILPAGYLGSMFWGALILIAASKTKIDKLISIIIGATVLAITLLFIRNGFGFIFGAAFGAAMVLIGLFAPGFINDIMLRFIGLTSILYAILDIKDDLIARTVNGSDAYRLSELIPLPPIVWGVIWIIIAVIVAFFALKISIRKKV